ncbi:MAG: class I SAM-dependent methyltransferase [Betaproteobacteria bacterium]|nr:class I SAM-dependent methyltransferase [Betaproteobacteria bacterium]
MQPDDRKIHWETVYQEKSETQVSWFQESPALSLELISALTPAPEASIIDVGGGASRLVDELVMRGYGDVTVLDLSQAALQAAQARLGAKAHGVEWIAADATHWRPQRTYDLWHDRAAFHFLTSPDDRAHYIQRLTEALAPGGHAIIATFALDGPDRCSGLPVVRYDAAALGAELGDVFSLIDTRAHAHSTPWGSIQRFQFSVFRRRLGD